jgi:hypothetical protein
MHHTSSDTNADRLRAFRKSLARWRQELSGTIAQCLNLEHEIHHNASKLCILGFEPLCDEHRQTVIDSWSTERIGSGIQIAALASGISVGQSPSRCGRLRLPARSRRSGTSAAIEPAEGDHRAKWGDGQ